MQMTCILQRLIIVLKTPDYHSVHAFCLFNLYFEISDEITRKVIFCQLKEQLVLFDWIRVVNQHIDEVHIAFGTQFNSVYRVAVVQHIAAPTPYRWHVELGTTQLFSSLHAVDNHTRHNAKLAFRVGRDKRIEVLQTSFCIAVIQLTQCSYKQKLVTVGPIGETLCRHMRIA